MPALRERPEDVPLLAAHFAARHGEALRGRALPIAPAALAALQRHSWPGNVRELANAIERAIVLGSGENGSKRTTCPRRSRPVRPPRRARRPPAGLHPRCRPRRALGRSGRPLQEIPAAPGAGRQRRQRHPGGRRPGPSSQPPAPPAHRLRPALKPAPPTRKMPPAATEDFELPRRVLDAFTVLEVLSPQGFRRPEDLVGGDRRRLAALEPKALPWAGRANARIRASISTTR